MIDIGQIYLALSILQILQLLEIEPVCDILNVKSIKVQIHHHQCAQLDNLQDFDSVSLEASSTASSTGLTVNTVCLTLYIKLHKYIFFVTITYIVNRVAGFGGMGAISSCQS